MLEYFSSATQIGLTATPKETKEVSNIEYFGEPIYTYSLRQGTSPGKNGSAEIRVSFVIDDDLSGGRLKSLVEFDSQLRAATGTEVFFEPNSDIAKRSKFFVRREAAWTSPEQQQEAYQWLDTTHRAILKVIKPRLQKI